MPQAKGFLKVEADDPAQAGGTEPVTVPVYELNDVRDTALRVATPTGPGTIALAEPEEATLPQLRVMTDEGVRAVNYSTESFPRPYEDFSYGKGHYIGPVGNWDFSGDGALCTSDVGGSTIMSTSGAIGYPQPGDTFILEFGFGVQGTGEADEAELFFAGDSVSNRRMLNVTARTATNEVILAVSIPDKTINIGYRLEPLATLPVTLSEQTNYGILVKWFYDYTFSVEVYQGWGTDSFAGGTLLASAYQIPYWPDTKYRGRGFALDATPDTVINRIRLWDRILS